MLPFGAHSILYSAFTIFFPNDGKACNRSEPMAQITGRWGPVTAPVPSCGRGCGKLFWDQEWLDKHMRYKSCEEALKRKPCSQCGLELNPFVPTSSARCSCDNRCKHCLYRFVFVTDYQRHVEYRLEHGECFPPSANERWAVASGDLMSAL